MLKKFRDFDVEEYKRARIFESIDDEPEFYQLDSNDPDFGETFIDDDKTLLKLSRVVKNALDKNGLDVYKPSTIPVSVNGAKGVLFRNSKDIQKSIIVCKNNVKNVIIVFDKFEFGRSNKAVATYTSDKLGISGMLKYAIDDLKGTKLNEAKAVMELTNSATGVKERPRAGYTMGNVEKFKSFPEEIKDFLVKVVEENGGVKAKPTHCESYIQINYGKHDPMCEDFVELLGGLKDGVKFPSTIKYYFAIIIDSMLGKYEEVKGLVDGEYVAEDPVSKSAGKLYDIEEVEKKKAERAKAKLEKEMERFLRNKDIIKINCDAYCKYVKNNGIIKKEFMKGISKRGMYITGKAGVGKTHTIKKVLKDNHMVENRDYILLGNVPTTAPDLYRYCYKYNGKLIIFDDSANMVSGENRVSFWKQLLQTGGGIVDYPRSTKDDSEEFYDVKGKTRQQRYFEEIGKKTAEEKKEFIAKRMKILRKRYTTPGEYVDEDKISSEAYDDWKEEEKKIKPRMPNKFSFTGCVIIVGNTTFDDLSKSIQSGGMSEEDWVAVQDRMALVDVTPPSTSLWADIQYGLREEQKMSEEEKPSDECKVPRKYVDRFIEEVNMLLSGEEDDDNYVYQRVTWRLVDSIGLILKGTDNIDDFYWKEMLRSGMRKKRK